MTKEKKNMPKNGNQIQQSKHEQIFMLVKDKEGKVNIVAGNYRVSRKTFDTYKQADEYIGTKPYELIFNTCLVLTKENNHEQNEENPQI